MLSLRESNRKSRTIKSVRVNTLIGLGVFDCLARDIIDPDTGEVYPALSCYNNPEMAMRCTSINADKVIWSIKATSQFNSDCAFLLREGFKSGRIRLLINEYDAEDCLGELRGFNSLNPMERTKFQLPYIHTTMLIDELVKLQHEESAAGVKIYQRNGMRKDRYSSLSYNYYVATQLDNKLSRHASSAAQNMFIIKAPKSGKGVNRPSGTGKTRGATSAWNKQDGEERTGEFY